MKKIQPQQLSASIDNASYIDANKILMFVTNRGIYSRDLDAVFGNYYGSYYPFVSNEFISNNYLNRSPLFAANVWVAGKVNDSIRATISDFYSEFTPGPMENGTFMSDRPEFKVYKLNIDSLASNPNSDYLNWPVDQGAPVDQQGRPLMRGDQTLWSVYNDADPVQHTILNSEPLGIEIQQTFWAQDEDGIDTLPSPTIFEVTQLGSTGFIVTVDIIDESSLTGDDYSVTYTYDSLNTRHWNLNNISLGIKILEGQTHFDGSTSHGVTDGFLVRVNEPSRAKEWIYESAITQNLSPIAIIDHPLYTGGRWFTGGDHGGDLLFGGVFIEPNFNGETTVGAEDIPPIELRWRPMQSYTDLNSDGTYTIGEPFVVDDTLKTQKAFMYSDFFDGSYIGFYDVPFTVWDISDTLNPRQLNVVVRDRDQNQAWNLHIQHDPNYTDITGLANGGDFRFNYIMISNSNYDSTGTYFGDGTSGNLGWWENYDGIWTMWLDQRSGDYGTLAEEGILTLVPGEVDTLPDTFTFNTTPFTPITSGPDGTSIYMMYKLFNKGGNQIDSCFIAFWSDPDLGGVSDDLIGCDTLDDLFFCYNATNDDYSYGSAPPALGFKVIHGPLVPSISDNAIFDDVSVPNYKNLGMFSFIDMDGIYGPNNSDQAFWFMKGFYARQNNVPYVYNGDTLSYVHSGDPVLGIGDLDNNAADRLMMATVGPFDFAPGDSQYVLIKMTIGQGADRLSSITRMKEILNLPYQIPTGIDDDKPNQLPLSFSLSQNYPNPFNPTTNIKFSLPTKSDVTLKVFNILGQEVTTLLNKNMSAGHHSIDWDASKYATGLYFYKLTAGDFVKSKKMLLLK